MRKRAAAFTIIELLIVIAIIIVLAGLVIGTSGYVQKKGARSRAEAEIAAISAACESYKADNGIYPRTSDTDSLDARTKTNPVDYQTASVALYNALTGATNGSRSPDPNSKVYFAFKANMLNPPPPSTSNVTSIRDPFGNSYGYSTANQANASAGYNPTFDLWSTGGTGVPGIAGDPNQWIKNW